MFEKYELTDEEIDKYNLNHSAANYSFLGHGRVFPKRAAIDTKSNVILAKLSVHYDYSGGLYSLHLHNKTHFINVKTESIDPHIRRLSCKILELADNMTEYDYAVVIKEAVTAYEKFYSSNKNPPWYCVTILNSETPKPKSDRHSIDSIIQSMCLHAKQFTRTHEDLSKHLISRINSWGYDESDLDTFIETGEYKNTLGSDALQFIEYWIKEGKYIDGQYSGIRPMTISGVNFFDFKSS